MKQSIAACVVGLGLCVATAYAITEKQATVSPALEALKLGLVPSKVIDGPQTYKVTKETIDLLTKLHKEGGTIVLENDGKLTIKEGKK